MVVQQVPPPHAEVLQNLAIGLDSWDNVVKVKMVYTPGKVEGAKSAPGRGEGLRSTLGREGLRSTHMVTRNVSMFTAMPFMSLPEQGAPAAPPGCPAPSLIRTVTGSP